MYQEIEKFKDKVRSERKKELPTPFDLIYKNFESLGYNKKNENYFLENASNIILDLRNSSWNEFKKLENDFSQHIYSLLIENDDNSFDDMSIKEGIEKFTADYTEHIYSLQLSNTQSRRSRAGTEFESIIELILMGANIEFDTQGSVGDGVFETSELAKLVDCVVPGAAEYKLNKRNTSLISAKTSLRERWQEVGDEMSRTKAKEIYLVTLDEHISKNTLKLISKNNIIIVTTKFIKNDFYNSSPYVIDFEQMLQELKTRELQWENYQYPQSELQNKKELYLRLKEEYSDKTFVSNYYDELLKTL